MVGQWEGVSVVSRAIPCLWVKGRCIFVSEEYVKLHLLLLGGIENDDIRPRLYLSFGEHSRVRICIALGDGIRDTLLVAACCRICRA